MDCNGLLWISKNQVNGFEDASMDCYGMFKKRGSYVKERELRKVVTKRVPSLESIGFWPVLPQVIEGLYLYNLLKNLYKKATNASGRSMNTVRARRQ